MVYIYLIVILELIYYRYRYRGMPQEQDYPALGLSPHQSEYLKSDNYIKYNK